MQKRETSPGTRLVVLAIPFRRGSVFALTLTAALLASGIIGTPAGARVGGGLAVGTLDVGSGYAVSFFATFQQIPDGPTTAPGVAWECWAITQATPTVVAASTSLPECSLDGAAGNVPAAAPGHVAMANGVRTPGPTSDAQLCVQAAVTDLNDREYLSDRNCQLVDVTADESEIYAAYCMTVYGREAPKLQFESTSLLQCRADADPGDLPFPQASLDAKDNYEVFCEEWVDKPIALDQFCSVAYSILYPFEPIGPSGAIPPPPGGS